MSEFPLNFLHGNFFHPFQILVILTVLPLLSLRSKCCFYLQWNLKKTPTSWGGLMVKVQFKCVDTNLHETEHCVVIKYTGTFEGKHHCIIFSIKKYQVCLQLVNSCIGSSACLWYSYVFTTCRDKSGSANWKAFNTSL